MVSDQLEQSKPHGVASNDEEARALRQTQAGKANKTWRVLHRVTYVERPALMGFGRDLRALTVKEEVDTAAKITELKTKLEKQEVTLAKIQSVLEKLAEGGMTLPAERKSGAGIMGLIRR